MVRFAVDDLTDSKYQAITAEVKMTDHNTFSQLTNETDTHTQTEQERVYDTFNLINKD